MHSSRLDPRRPGGVLMFTLLSGLIAIPAAVLAQSGQHRVMVFDDASGSGPQVLHFSGPDFGQLRKPDFIRRDLPIFREHLRLDGVQHAIVGVLLDAYLDAFKLLMETSLPQDHFAPHGMGMNMILGDDPDGAGGEDIGTIIRDAMRNADGFTDIEMHGEGSGNMEIAIMVGVGDGGDMDDLGADIDLGEQSVAVWAMTGEDPDDETGPSAGVFIAVGGPDGVELPVEVREKLEKVAREMAERLRARLEQAEADGVDLADEFPSAETFEDRKARMDDMRKSMETFKRQKAILKQEFLTQVRAQLTAEQFGNWPGFERALTRIKTLPTGRLDGERTDLLVVAGELDLSEEQREAVAEALETYELALDEALRERNDYVDDASARMDKAIQDRDFLKALSIVDSATRRRVAVRSVNERSVDAIAEKLPAEPAAKFRDDAMRRSYPRVYRRTVGQKSFTKARALPGLDAEALAGIGAIEDAYEAQLALVNERIRTTIHRYQPKETRQAIERIAAMMSGEDDGLMRLGGHDEDDPIRAAFKKRTNLDTRYMKQLHAVLTAEQVAELPRLPSERQRMPFIMQRSTASD